MNKLMLQMAIMPPQATNTGIRFLLIGLVIYYICHPCHYFEESNNNSNTKNFLKFNGNGGNLTVHGVLGKIEFFILSDPLIKVLANV